MTNSIMGNRIILKFDGRDYSVGIAQYLSKEIKLLPKQQRTWMYAEKLWSIDIAYQNNIKIWTDRFWYEWRIKKFNPIHPQEMEIDKDAAKDFDKLMED